MKLIGNGWIPYQKRKDRMKYVAIFMMVAIVILNFILVYQKDLYDGEWNYKKSHRMYLSLKSAYNYGYQDCREERPNDWDGQSYNEYFVS
jgi:hypothetical protein